MWLNDKRTISENGQSNTGTLICLQAIHIGQQQDNMTMHRIIEVAMNTLQIPVTEEGYLHFLLSAEQQGDDAEMLVYFH